MIFIKRFVSGIFIGVANIIPGVSGGTIAVVMGVFDDMIGAINQLRRQFKKSVGVLLPVLAGMLAGILALSRVIESALDNYAFPTNLFFVGLVAGSIPLVFRKANTGKFKASYLIPFVIAAAVVVVMSLFTGEKTETVVSTVSVGMMVQLFFAGAIAAAAMVVPGVSGSFILILLGYYKTVLGLLNMLTGLLKEPSLAVFGEAMKGILPLGIGILLGIALISKLIEWLMRMFYQYTYYAILGLVAALIFGILWNRETYATGTEPLFIGLAVVAFAVGVALALLLGKEREPAEEKDAVPETEENEA